MKAYATPPLGGPEQPEARMAAAGAAATDLGSVGLGGRGLRLLHFEGGVWEMESEACQRGCGRGVGGRLSRDPCRFAPRPSESSLPQFPSPRLWSRPP